MSIEMTGACPYGSHEQFVERASHIFLPKEVSRWSRIERAVFSHLMAQPIHRYGYSAISDQKMLLESREKLDSIVRQWLTISQTLTRPTEVRLSRSFPDSRLQHRRPDSQQQAENRRTHHEQSDPGNDPSRRHHVGYVVRGLFVVDVE